MPKSMIIYAIWYIV